MKNLPTTKSKELRADLTREHAPKPYTHNRL